MFWLGAYVCLLKCGFGKKCDRNGEGSNKERNAGATPERRERTRSAIKSQSYLENTAGKPARQQDRQPAKVPTAYVMVTQQCSWVTPLSAHWNVPAETRYQCPWSVRVAYGLSEEHAPPTLCGTNNHAVYNANVCGPVRRLYRNTNSSLNVYTSEGITKHCAPN